MRCNANDWGDLNCTMMEGHSGPCDYQQPVIQLTKMERGGDDGWTLHELHAWSNHNVPQLLRTRAWWESPEGTIHQVPPSVPRPSLDPDGDGA